MGFLDRVRRTLFPRRSRLEGWLQRWCLEPLRAARRRESVGDLDAVRSARAALLGRAPASAPPASAGRPRILYLLHEATGGVGWTHRDLMSRVADAADCFVLTGSLHRLRLERYDVAARRTIPVEAWWPGRAWSQARYRDPAYRRVYEQVLERLEIDLVHVRHLLGHTLDVLDLCRDRQMPVVVSFHDYYLTCPSIHLLDDTGTYCGGACTPTPGQCRLPIDWLGDLPVLKSGPLEAWRRAIEPALDPTWTCVTTSQAARDVIERVYPALALQVIEHGRDFEDAGSIAVEPTTGIPARILVAGHLGQHKGVDYLRRLVALDRQRDQRLEVHLLGSAAPGARDWATVHGTFERDEFRRRAAEIGPSFGGVFSIWPETYSHTLTEAWSVGLPVLATDLGAPAERIRACGGGWLLPLRDAEAAYHQILAILDDGAEYRRQVEKAHVRDLPSVDDMAAAYLVVYRRLGLTTSPKKGSRSRIQSGHSCRERSP